MAPTAVATNTSPIVHIPYITNKQFRLQQTPVNVDNLVPKGTPAEQEAALATLILTASTIVYGIVHQLLYATVDTEQDELEVDRWGRLLIHPRFFPILELTDLWLGPDPGSLVQVSSFTGVEVDPKRIVVTQNVGSPVLTSSAGPLEFGGFGAAAASPLPSYARWTYGNGWPVTRLAAPVAAGATSIQVVNPNGINLTTPLRIEDGADREVLTVAGPVSGTTVPVAPVANAHLVGEAATALPADAEQAVGLIVTALAKRRGAGALVAGTTANTKSAADPFGAADDMIAAQRILEDGDYVAVGGRS